MPGSYNSEKSSSASLISSLRRFRFQNKSKQDQKGETSVPSSSTIGSSPRTADRPLSQKSSSATAYNPLSYRKYENPNDTFVLLQSISSKIQTLFKNNNISSVLDLKLTVEETKKLKDTVLQQPAISMKWSSNITEHADTNSVDKVLKVKRAYLYELAKYITDVLNSKLNKNNKLQFTPENPTVQNNSRARRTENTVNQSPISNSSSSDNQSQGAMDDYEEFCEKEQCLRKMLDAFPGADIMEAQDILVKCQWDLNKAMVEARNQPLRTTRKRGYTGSFIAQSPTGTNMPNQRSMVNTSQNANDSKKIPEEIVLDSSDDDEEINGNASQKSSSSRTNNAQSHNAPPQKRVRRLISTDSEDEASASVTKSPVAANYQTQQLTVSSVQQKSAVAVQQKSTTPVQQKPATSVQPKVPSSVQQKPALSIQQKTAAVDQKLVSSVQPKPVPPKQAATVRTSVSNNSFVEKTINVPQSLSIKPVSTNSSTTNNDKPAASAMPTLPKGLVITQVGGMDNKKPEKEGSPANVNSSNNIPSNSSKSAHLVRIKPSSGVSGASSVQSATATVTSTAIMNNNSNKAYTIPKTKGVSITPVNKVNIIPKTLSITPVGASKEPPVKEKSPGTSTEDESSSDTKSQMQKQSDKKDIQDKGSKDLENFEESNDADESQPPEAAKSFEKHKRKNSNKFEKNRKHNSGKRKRFSSDDDDDEEYGNEDIYDSEDSDCEENLTSAHCAVLKFFQESTADELGTVPGCSKKKIEAIINHRPFTKWIDLVDKLKNDKTLSTDLLNGAKKVLDMRNAITKLMTKCQRISLDMEDLVENLKENKETCTDYVSKQPSLLNERMHLTGYQMLGLNWLLLMHNQQVNAILADEMGLGKTVQAISFLAYLKQIEEEGPHLIVVPSSTLDNWRKELETWWPTVSVICYHGQQESRRELRMQILNDECEEFDVMITTYNMVTSSAEDRNFFKRLEFNYVVFDEAHMLKNMASQRYTNLMRIKAPRRLLLTGTPLQNNLVELMSLLIFAMPHMFSGKTEQIKQMFSCVSKATGNKNSYEKDRIDHAKRIMKPFVLRRLKRDVLKELPEKHDETRYCPMTEDQAEKYEALVKQFSAEVQVESSDEKESTSSGAGMMMQLRRAANHPLLLRRFFDDDKLLSMSKKMLKEPTHSQSDPNVIFEDMAVMSDFELHKLCKQYKSISSFALPDSAVLNSGKFKVLDELLPALINEDHRILLFSQFTMVLDIVQEYMNIKKYKFLRLDGQVPVSERQQLIDDFNNDPEILVFLLSTRAGGLGINLTAADTVILHDIDFNPYNDKQAEDRCHRVGQVRDVKVIRMISENTIEEGILQRAKEKLKLEKDIHDEGDNEENDTASVAKLLRDALGLKPNKS